MDHYLLSFINGTLSPLSPESLSAVTFVVAAALLLLFLRIGGAIGVFCFINLAYIVSNIQVLHAAQFSFLSEPVALGTVLFAMTYLATDIVTEHYGPRRARQAVALSFLTQVGFTLLMLLTLAHPPLPEHPGNGDIYKSMSTLFTPSLRILVASLASYYISQLLDIAVFQKIADMTHKRFLWLRTTVSTSLSALADNIIFSTLAWVLLSPDPVSLRTLIMTYILGTYVARVFVSIAGVPVMYLSYTALPKKNN